MWGHVCCVCCVCIISSWVLVFIGVVWVMMLWEGTRNHHELHEGGDIWFRVYGLGFGIIKLSIKSPSHSPPITSRQPSHTKVRCHIVSWMQRQASPPSKQGWCVCLLNSFDLQLFPLHLLTYMFLRFNLGMDNCSFKVG
jgi:hypothetical protein